MWASLGVAIVCLALLWMGSCLSAGLRLALGAQGRGTRLKLISGRICAGLSWAGLRHGVLSCLCESTCNGMKRNPIFFFLKRTHRHCRHYVLIKPTFETVQIFGSVIITNCAPVIGQLWPSLRDLMVCSSTDLWNVFQTRFNRLYLLCNSGR